jgi:hypothetical protein
MATIPAYLSFETPLKAAIADLRKPVTKSAIADFVAGSSDEASRRSSG